MAISKITLIGFYNYMNASGDDLFKYVSFPNGINKDTAIDTILLTGGEFEILYSDPIFMQQMIKLWSDKYQHTFERWVRALTEDYNPLHNFDRHEEYKDIRGIKENETQKGKITNNTNNSTISNGTSEDVVSAFNSDTYQPKEKTIAGDNVTGNGSSTTNSDNTNNKNTDETLDHNAHLFGNIGLTTSQQMASDEIRLRRDYNIYNLIADLFLNEFCIYVY